MFDILTVLSSGVRQTGSRHLVRVNKAAIKRRIGMRWNFHDNTRNRATAPRRSRSEAQAWDAAAYESPGVELGSDFLEGEASDPSAEALERGLRREERRHVERRKAIAGFGALAVAGTVLLGGAIAALAASHGPSSRTTASAGAYVQPVKAKKKAKKKRSAKAAAAARRARAAASAK